MSTRCADRAPRAFSSFVRSFAGVGLVALAVGCASEPSSRSLHYIDGELVTSTPVHHASYAAYLRARLALESQPADLVTAGEEIETAIKIEPREPHLWTTLAEVELQRGDRDAALEASRIALQLRPDYGPAKQLMAKLEGGDTSTATMTNRPSVQP